MSPPPLFRPGAALPILWENDRCAIINKPSGLPVHPGPRTTDTVESRFLPQKRGGPWLVHRLDADTAGCLLITRRKTALTQLQEAFAQRQVRKIYWAIVQGRPMQAEGLIDNFLRKESLGQGKGWKMAAVPASGMTGTDKGSGALPARTRWKLVAHNPEKDLSLLELDLLTGRTHQARVHCATLGTPILGDPVYGTVPHPGLSHVPMQLLARQLQVKGPESEKPLEAVAPPEADMARLIATMAPA
ncbi:RluA family pseudouridine synthase [Oecophyllibacter saccharovorans]|uniref:RluA family pseudouridine synthase n=1 Tax=Oecophyllibacter saccharovorans TaxID=2558360 RepID=UPI00116949B1|nr:RluA family pseudouridine synthase [Oecophyllibacter saccharovorans]TPW35074.1 RluA family pseudouridine synthase [Oecophyllibacter saccharovorans]